MAALGPWDELKRQEQARRQPPAAGLAPRDIAHVATTTPRRGPNRMFCGGDPSAQERVFRELLACDDVLWAKDEALRLVAEMLPPRVDDVFRQIMARVV